MRSRIDSQFARAALIEGFSARTSEMTSASRSVRFVSMVAKGWLIAALWFVAVVAAAPAAIADSCDQILNAKRSRHSGAPRRINMLLRAAAPIGPPAK